MTKIITSAEKAKAILEALKDRAGNKEIWAEELALSSGARRCDFWTLHPHASKGYRATAYEIKVSRQDFRRETHLKQREARLFSDQFYYAAPAGLIQEDEIPDWAGLMEFTDSGSGVWRVSRIISAPIRDKDAPSWELIVSIMRFSGSVRRDTDIMRNELDFWREKAKRLEDEKSAAMARARERIFSGSKS